MGIRSSHNKQFKIEFKSNLNLLEKILDVQFLYVYALTRFEDVCKQVNVCWEAMARILLHGLLQRNASDDVNVNTVYMINLLSVTQGSLNGHPDGNKTNNL